MIKKKRNCVIPSKQIEIGETSEKIKNMLNFSSISRKIRAHW
ncbi:hypothetical protein KKC1_07670 [Calderihabitans maritimus]|uniref:Uncharacterized protein n=1 Tax=Calderihabitans maritimus TaxID=1246530 RepID=A0A1Z5HPY9_9FIRM|nr:hypothetical protein KKC1_07670 [Calderihabitans maritimus]